MAIRSSVLGWLISQAGAMPARDWVSSSSLANRLFSGAMPMPALVRRAAAYSSASYSFFLERIFHINQNIIEIGVYNIPNATIQTAKLDSEAHIAEEISGILRAIHNTNNIIHVCNILKANICKVCFLL